MQTLRFFTGRRGAILDSRWYTSAILLMKPLILAVSMILIFFLWGCSRAEEPADVIIRNGRILVGNGDVLERGTLVISGERILTVGEDVPPREALLEIDASGKTVVPGLMDVHVHLIIAPEITSDQRLEEVLEGRVRKNLSDFLAYGVTTVKSTGDPEDAVLELRDRIERGEIPGPRLRVVGPVLSAPNGHPSKTVFRDNPWLQEHAFVPLSTAEEAREAVIRLARKKVDGLKIVFQGSATEKEYLYAGQIPIERLSREAMEAVISEGHRHGLRVTAHTIEEEGLVPVVEAGIDSLEHGVVATSPVSQQVIDMILDRGISYIPTLQVFATRSSPENLNRAMANLKQLSDQGVRIVLGTDTVSGHPSGLNTILEAERMEQAGMRAGQVLQAATLNAAAHLGLEEELGSLEPGKVADLVILEDNPLSNLSTLRNPWLVMKGGRVVFDRAE